MKYFRETMTGKLLMISGNWCETKTVSDLTHFLFDFDDGIPRTPWEDLPFRKLYRRAVVRIDAIECPRSTRGEEKTGSKKVVLRQKLFERLLSHHWILAYPNQDAIMQKT